MLLLVQKRFIQLTSEETVTLQEGMKNGTAHCFANAVIV